MIGILLVNTTVAAADKVKHTYTQNNHKLSTRITKLLKVEGLTFEWKVTYPSCDLRGYWASGCGQPETKVQGVVKCYGYGKDSKSPQEAQNAKCTNKKPAAPARVCPATKPCRTCGVTNRFHTL